MSQAQELTYEEEMQVDLAEIWQNEIAREAIRKNEPFNLVRFNATLLIKAQQILESETERIIAGYANIQVPDTQDEMIEAQAWHESFAKFMANPKFRLVHVFHTDIPVGEVLPFYKDSKGRIWRSKVDDQGLFVVIRIRTDTIASDRVWTAIEDGELRAFSISGLALERDPIPKHAGGRTYRIITKLELHSITICERGSNPGAIFTIVKSMSPASLLRIHTKRTRPSMSLEEEAILTSEKDLNPDGSQSTGQKPPADNENVKKDPTTATGTRKQDPASGATDMGPLILEMNSKLDKLVGEVEKLKAEDAKAPKDDEEEDDKEKAGKPSKYPYPEDKEKAKKPPGKYPPPGAKGEKPEDEEEEDKDKEKEKKPEEEEEYPPPEKKKGEIAIMSSIDLAKQIEEIAERKAVELINKSLGRTEKRGTVANIGGPTGTSTPTAISVLRMPMAKMGSMEKGAWLNLLATIQG